ncbi:CPBP family intramembrane metalloprotease [Microbispora sp. SCL1-1]|uniref:CPBP family intramembrane glutamic endopeptidase n=1 Tax=unclassified Microbispora TaxID=2614687 RepID=UPI0011582312|nr:MULTISPECIES: CPBP family intramembrane glutamic endopeptidase [unclassified Microbispora]NJP29871.1 CPBP family intramembrane metalloprotease [Microbispora sp. CL1-1]TQS03815.1 CPBP family intramembrane metalloprotease [Microbispora sp. SCL1-1]
MRLLKQLVAVAVVAFAGGALVGAVQGNAFVTLVLGLGTAVLAVVVYARVVRWSERRTPVEVAGKGAVPAVGRGLLIGAGMFAAVIVNLAFLGYFRIDGLGSVTGAIGLLGFMAAAAVTEELLFRGVLFRIVEERTGTWIALGLSGLVFGLMHLGNEHASLWGAIAIAVESGGMLAAAYAATRTLWLPIGVHFGWNFAEAGIFSAEVSGNGATHGLLNSVTSGPALLTGGDFGPEASPYAVVFGALLTIVFLWLARRRGNLVPLRRHARAAAAATLSQ